jgi:hypothetical protein
MQVTQGVLFFGFRIFLGVIRLDGKKWVRFSRCVQQRKAQYAGGMIEVD